VTKRIKQMFSGACGFLCVVILAGTAYGSNTTVNQSYTFPTKPSDEISARDSYFYAVRRKEWQPSMVEDRPIFKREEGLEIKGEVPKLTNEAADLRVPVDKMINEVVNKKICAAKDAKAKEIRFKYDVYHTNDYVSIIIWSTVTKASPKTEVSSVNFNTEDGRAVSAAEAIGKNAVRLADKLLAEMIRRNPENYINGFTGLLEDQSFYVANDKAVFFFDEFQLASGTDDIVQLELTLSAIKSYSIPKDEYVVKPGYNIRMIPLSLVCEQFGYKAEWKAGKVFLFYDGEFVMELTPGVNNYQQRRLQRSLEAAPEIIKDTTYVPISFFDQILNLVTYSIDAQGSITFSAYTRT